MKEYNDFIIITSQYLKNYNKFKDAIKNINNEIVEQTKLLQGESVAIARYGDSGHGVSELNGTEAAANRRLQIGQKINAMRENRDEIERLLRRIDIALEILDETDRAFLVGHYIDRYGWQQLSLLHHCSERWAREKASRALRDVAGMMFGVLAKPTQLRFVFAL